MSAAPSPASNRLIYTPKNLFSYVFFNTAFSSSLLFRFSIFLTTARNQQSKNEIGNMIGARVRVITPVAGGGGGGGGASLPDILDTSRAFNSSLHQASELSPLSELL